MNYLIEDTVIEELERAVCRLESMGTILVSLCEPDRNMPDLSSMADLGTLISQQAMDILNLLAEKEQMRPAPVEPIKPQLATLRASSDEPLPRIWFIPEIPND